MVLKGFIGANPKHWQFVVCVGGRSPTRRARSVLSDCDPATGFMPDDGSGEKEIWRVENFELAPVDPTTYGRFFGGDSYVIKYKYYDAGREKYIIYFWQVNVYQNKKWFRKTNDQGVSSYIFVINKLLKVIILNLEMSKVINLLWQPEDVSNTLIDLKYRMYIYNSITKISIKTPPSDEQIFSSTIKNYCKIHEQEVKSH